MAWSYRWNDDEEITVITNDAPDMEAVEIDVVVPGAGDRARAVALAEIITMALNVLDEQEWAAIEDAAAREVSDGSNED